MLRWGSAGWCWPPPPIAIVLAFVFAAAPPTAQATYTATVDTNTSAFSAGCLGFSDPYPDAMYDNAVAAYKTLAYDVRGYEGSSFTKARTLANLATDWGFYVHSHGDHYAVGWGFRSDEGKCSGAPIVTSSDIGAARSGRQSNLVVLSTCHLGEAASDMPAAFAIEKQQVAWYQPEFYLGYKGSVYDSDQWRFEKQIWSRLLNYSLGQAFDLAVAAGGYHSGFVAQWWGSYNYYGWAGPYTGCLRCV